MVRSVHFWYFAKSAYRSTSRGQSASRSSGVTVRARTGRRFSPLRLTRVVRVRGQVGVPLRVLRQPALRGDDHEVVAVLEVEQRRLVRACRTCGPRARAAAPAPASSSPAPIRHFEPSRPLVALNAATCARDMYLMNVHGRAASPARPGARQAGPGPSDVRASRRPLRAACGCASRRPSGSSCGGSSRRSRRSCRRRCRRPWASGCGSTPSRPPRRRAGRRRPGRSCASAWGRTPAAPRPATA